jgi:hypothetical protein
MEESVTKEEEKVSPQKRIQKKAINHEAKIENFPSGKRKLNPQRSFQKKSTKSFHGRSHVKVIMNHLRGFAVIFDF